jgi:heme-degrading monooxygenase HmoA
MVLVLSRFRVANGMAVEVKAAFVNRPHEVENAPGFVRLDVVSPSDEPEEIWLLTYWKDKESFERWHGSDAHRHSHQFIPKGLKLEAAATQVRVFEYVSS